DLYDDFLQDPSSEPEDLQVLFSTIKNVDSIVPALKSTSRQISDGTIKRVMRLIDIIRQYGHLKADIYPVNSPKRKHVSNLEIEDFDLDQQTLEGTSAGNVSDHFADIYDNSYEAILRMDKRYKGPIAF
ncbi:hypothetical protein QP62_00040, partial [Staphylococcus aureus]